jgi:uncharacterized protein (DUF2147 family)
MNKKIISVLCVLFISISMFSQVDKIVGRWKTIDDKDGSTKSIVLVFKATNGKYYGKVEKLFKNPDKKCTECEGANKDKAVLGMMVVNGMKENEGSLTGGTILDPNNGKVYRCSMTYDAKTGNLDVRGSLDKFGMIGRTQVWVREK